MKKQICIIFTLFPFSLFSMDIELQDRKKQKKIEITHANIEKIALSINTAINQQYPQTIGSFFTQKTEADHLKILKAPQTHYPPIKINNLLVEKLVNCSTQFTEAIAYFSNIENVNCNTLQLIESNPEESDIPKCYKLPKAIRSYIVKSAQTSIKNLRFRYEIILESRHKYPINLYSIWQEKDIAATYDNISGEIQLWDLTTGKCSWHFYASQHVTALEFAHLSTKPLLFIGQTKKPSGSIIRTWNIESKEQVKEFICHKNYGYIIEDFAFSKLQSDIPLTLMSVLIKKINTDALIKQWILTPEECIPSDLVIRVTPSFNYSNLRQGPYEVNNPTYFRSRSQLGIFKYNSHDLYFCQQAIKTIANTKDIEKIISSNSYKNLNRYKIEKEIIDEHIASKRDI